MSTQARLDFTPAASELAKAVRRREGKADRILARLTLGPATSFDLALYTHRFGARLHELRARGYKIEREDHVLEGLEWSVYTLKGEL